MTDTYTSPADGDRQDHELVDRLITLHPPKDEEVARRMDTIREAFLTIGHMVVDIVPRTPDRTVALRKIHDACQASIGALACNQELA